MALCYLDIDHFKSVNDALGHAAGVNPPIAVGGGGPLDESDC